jgi:hypothetical protein
MGSEMLFADVQTSLVAILRSKVRNGEMTERGLARVVGVSQPHIHNVLKGVRSLSPQLSDQILQHLRLSVLDLIERERLQTHLSLASPGGGYVYVPMLRGSIGPDCPWPTDTVRTERLPFPASQVHGIENPVAVRLGEDARMNRTVSCGDVALLDQSHRARTNIDPAAFYVVKLGAGGVLRRVRVIGYLLYLVPDDAQDLPLGWQRISIESRPISQFIRARAYLATSLYEWNAKS